MSTRLSVVLVASLIVSGCGTSSPEPAESAATAPDAPLGVAECDAFLQKAMACIERVPEEERAQLRAQLGRRRLAWAKVAVLEASKSTLSTLCAEAARQAPREFEAYGCDW